MSVTNNSPAGRFSPVVDMCNEAFQLMRLCHEATDYIETSRKEDPEHAGNYYYYKIDNNELTVKINQKFLVWKALVQRISQEKYTLASESTVSNNHEDDNTLVITELARINLNNLANNLPAKFPDADHSAPVEKHSIPADKNSGSFE